MKSVCYCIRRLAIRHLAACCVLLLLAAPAFGQSSVTVAPGGSVGVSGTLHLWGDFVNEGIFTAADARVVFRGATNQTFEPNTAPTLVSVVVDKASTTAVILADSLVVTDSVLVLGGDLDLGGNEIDLGLAGALRETPGNAVTGASGTITATRFLNAPNAVNVAGLGARISSSANMSATVVTRGHTPQTGTNANESIARYYDIQPALNTGLNATLEFFFYDTELNGLDENLLELWHSDDGGATFTKVGGTVIPSANVIAFSGIDAFSRWTAASTAAPLPVELAAFEARVEGRDVVLTWQTLSEHGNDGYAVEWKEGETKFSAVGGQREEWKKVAFIEGRGTPAGGHAYAYRAEGLDYGTYRFRLKQVDLDGTASILSEVEAVVALSQVFALSEAYPNPFRQRATLELAVRAAQDVRVEVYDVLGRRVRSFEQRMPANETMRLTFDGRDLASGVYFVRVIGEDFAGTRRLVRVR